MIFLLLTVWWVPCFLVSRNEGRKTGFIFWEGSDRPDARSSEAGHQFFVDAIRDPGVCVGWCWWGWRE